MRETCEVDKGSQSSRLMWLVIEINSEVSKEKYVEHASPEEGLTD